MKAIQFHPEQVFIPLVENFVSAICDDSHLDNYLATISVSVLKAVELAASSPVAADTSTVSLVSDFCPGGIFFSVQTSSPCFFTIDDDTLPAEGSVEESLFLIQSLSDTVSVQDNGCSLRMEFAVRGIDVREMNRRQSLMTAQKVLVAEVV